MRSLLLSVSFSARTRLKLNTLANSCSHISSSIHRVAKPCRNLSIRAIDRTSLHNRLGTGTDSVIGAHDENRGPCGCHSHRTQRHGSDAMMGHAVPMANNACRACTSGNCISWQVSWDTATSPAAKGNLFRTSQVDVLGAPTRP